MVRVSPEVYLGVVDPSQPTQPIVNNNYTSDPNQRSLSTSEEELAQIKFLIIGLAIGLALGIAIYAMMRDRR
jgi:hypothetical protein